MEQRHGRDIRVSARAQAAAGDVENMAAPAQGQEHLRVASGLLRRSGDGGRHWTVSRREVHYQNLDCLSANDLNRLLEVVIRQPVARVCVPIGHRRYSVTDPDLPPICGPASGPAAKLNRLTLCSVSLLELISKTAPSHLSPPIPSISRAKWPVENLAQRHCLRRRQSSPGLRRLVIATPSLLSKADLPTSRLERPLWAISSHCLVPNTHLFSRRNPGWERNIFQIFLTRL